MYVTYIIYIGPLHIFLSQPAPLPLTSLQKRETETSQHNIYLRKSISTKYIGYRKVNGNHFIYVDKVKNILQDKEEKKKLTFILGRKKI